MKVLLLCCVVSCCVGLAVSREIPSYPPVPECGPAPACRAPDLGCTVKPVKDKNGCLTGCTYDCPCPLALDCPKKICLNGYALDENGCQTCQCKCGPLPPCAPPPPGCHAVLNEDENGCVTGCDYNCPCGPLKLCPNTCKFGFLQDSNGCDTCQCRCPLRHKCGTRCPNGYLEDADGCSTCQCRPGLECHKWMKCSQGVCPTACACKPNCLEILQK